MGSPGKRSFNKCPRSTEWQWPNQPWHLNNLYRTRTFRVRRHHKHRMAKNLDPIFWVPAQVIQHTWVGCLCELKTSKRIRAQQNAGCARREPESTASGAPGAKIGYTRNAPPWWGKKSKSWEDKRGSFEFTKCIESRIKKRKRRPNEDATKTQIS